MHMRQLPFPAAVWTLLSATPHTPVGILLQVDHALQLHTTDNVSVITICFRDTPPPRRMQREVPPVFPAEADACNTTVAACCRKLSLSNAVLLLGRCCRAGGAAGRGYVLFNNHINEFYVKPFHAARCRGGQRRPWAARCRGRGCRC